MRVILTAIQAIDSQRALGWRIESAEDAAERGLARRNPADDTDPLTGIDLQCDSQKRLLRRVRIDKRDVLELDMAGTNLRDDAAQCNMPLVLDLHHPLERVQSSH